MCFQHIKAEKTVEKIDAIVASALALRLLLHSKDVSRSILDSMTSQIVFLSVSFFISFSSTLLIRYIWREAVPSDHPFNIANHGGETTVNKLRGFRSQKALFFL